MGRGPDKTPSLSPRSHKALSEGWFLIRLREKIYPKNWFKLLRQRKPAQLLGILGFQGDGALGAHQRFARLVPGKGMFRIAFGTLKDVGAFFAAETTFATCFHIMGFVFGHANFLLDYLGCQPTNSS